MMSIMGVPFIRSAPPTISMLPRFASRSTRRRRTQLSPSEFGRNGERVAKTPMRVLPPSRGGRTVGDQSPRTASENCQMSQRWGELSIPRSASCTRYFV